ncbi:MAG: hypothetical protein RLZ45_400, partial [Verrucomicrobiota bacterium]
MTGRRSESGATAPSSLGSTGFLVRSLWSLVAEDRKKLLGGLALATVRVGIAVPVALMLKQVLESFSRGNMTGEIILIPLGLMLVIGAFGAASHQLIDTAVRRSLGRFRIRLVDQILSLPKVVHDGSERMRLHTLVVTDIETVQRSLNSLATQIVPNGLLAVVLITVLAVQSPAMVLGLMASLIASHLVTNHLWQNLLAAQRRFRSTLTEFGSEFATTLRTLELTWYQQGSVLELERHRSIIKRLT